MLKEKKIKLSYFALIISFVNLILYQFPFYKFVVNNIDFKTYNGYLLLISLIVLGFILNAFVFYLLTFLFRIVGKWILALLFLINSIALYFINTYSVMLDRTMMGNVFNTNFDESSSFFSLNLILYVIFLGILPSIFIFKLKTEYPKIKRFLIHFFLTLLLLLSFVWANATNWLWIDKNSGTLGSLVMPWSYVVNTVRYYSKKSKQNEKQILLPNATIKNKEKAVFVLVIGESARSQNFSLYGYEKETNPLLSKMPDVNHFTAQSCATYTTAGVKCILEHENTNKLYEILPNYLHRNGVEVIWRTTNSGEPKVTIEKYQDKKYLQSTCKGENCSYDKVLIDNLKEEILASKKDKILIVLHSSTSHGPTYNQKHPPQFSKFIPECENVELAKCSHQELINAYDNTIVYTDYLLATLINDLNDLKEYKSSMIFVSDHGESLGENNLYMHGLPISIAPKEQFDIPFIIWTSKNAKKQLKNTKTAEQHNVFHTVLDFLAIESPIYDENMSLFQE